LRIVALVLGIAAALTSTIAAADLPKMGVAGNTHMLMMDTNSDQVAQMIQKWMADRGLMK
jgi:hypothetical protein